MKNSFYAQDKIGTFLSPNKISIGTGAAKQVGIESKALGGKKALIVTDPGVVKAGLIDGIQESLESEKIRTGIFDRVIAEPPARVIDEGAQIAHEEGYDIIIGVGGGSSLDAAKGASIMATNKGRVLDYAGIDMIPKGGLPKILLPTTGGTGSEVTRVFVVTDEAENTKKVVYSNFNLADVAIIDPLLSISMPPAVTADTGIDALVHAIEAYVSVNATPFSDILAIESIGLIAENLPIAYAKGSSIEARYNMVLAANLAGLAFTSGGLGAVHGLAYVLGTEYHMSHGRSNAIMLPHVMDYNTIGNLEKYAQIARAMGEHIQGLCAYKAADKSIDAVKKLLEAVDISIRLPEYGIRKEDLPRLVQGGMKQARLFVPNPRDLTKEDVEKIYKMALI
ncbi:MAG: iron-containing alcohol dehydrogenase [Deltaproteobacteria bacterium]|nr:MAG: iron-containing alcohol dehydrogenase [Deltaproteobacteria bacterium]